VDAGGTIRTTGSSTVQPESTSSVHVYYSDSFILDKYACCEFCTGTVRYSLSVQYSIILYCQCMILYCTDFEFWNLDHPDILEILESGGEWPHCSGSAVPLTVTLPVQCLPLALGATLAP
jgi:hypothetical protein